MTLLTRLVSLFFGTLLFACESCGAGANNVARDEPLDPLVYDVHEWGLVDVYAQGLDILAGSPRFQRWQQAPELMVTDKPVAYFHYVSGDMRPLNLEVEIPNGEVREMWPSFPSEASDIPQQTQMSRVGIALASTQQCVVPEDLGRLCRENPARDRYCERGELPRYQTNDATCLQIWSPQAEHVRTSAPFFFYRGAQARSAQMPIAIAQGRVLQQERLDISHALVIDYGSRDGDGRVDGDGVVADVTVDDRLAAQDETIAQDSPVRVPLEVRAPRFRIVQLTENQPVGAGAELGVVVERAQALDLVRTDLQSIGLTPSETDSFLRAWEGELLDGRNVDGSGIRGRVLLYWLPQTMVSRVAVLTLSPHFSR